METKTPLKTLQDYHGQKFTAEQSKDYEWFFKQRRNGDQLVTNWKFKHSPRDRFPSLAELATIDQEMREALWAKEKAHAPIFADIKRNAQRVPSGNEAIELMQSLSEHKLTSEQYIARMYEMDEKYPGVGWKQNANELKKLLAKDAQSSLKFRY